MSNTNIIFTDIGPQEGIGSCYHFQLLSKEDSWDWLKKVLLSKAKRLKEIIWHSHDWPEPCAIWGWSFWCPPERPRPVCIPNLCVAHYLWNQLAKYKMFLKVMSCEIVLSPKLVTMVELISEMNVVNKSNKKR